jgi:uncharacterized membrane protein YbhN (UPF0104 family)
MAMTIEPRLTGRPVHHPGQADSRADTNATSHARTALGITVSVVSVAGCVLWALHQSAPRFPHGIDRLSLLAAALGVYAAATFARGWRWHVILRRAGVPHDPIDAYGLTVVGYMGNTVLPARGGELLRILLLSQRSTARRREILGSIVPERILDAAALVVLFAAVTFAGSSSTPAGNSLAWVAAGGLLALVIASFAYLRLRVAGKLVGFADRVRPVARASRLLLTWTGLGLLGLTLTVWSGESGICWLVGESLRLSMSPVDALVVVVLANFFALIPAAPGYVGTFDAAVLFALRHFGIAGGAAVGFAILFRFIVFVPVTVAGLVLMMVRYGGPDVLRAPSRRAGVTALAPEHAADVAIAMPSGDRMP